MNDYHPSDEECDAAYTSWVLYCDPLDGPPSSRQCGIVRAAMREALIAAHEHRQKASG